MVAQGPVAKGGHLEALSPLGSASACLWGLFSVAWSNTQQVSSMGTWALVGISVPITGDEDAEAGGRSRDGAQPSLDISPTVLVISTHQQWFSQNPMR